MPPRPTACLIIIGNEILSGRTQDKNLAWIANELNNIGVGLQECRVVQDIEADVVAAVNACRAKYAYVFTTGGIGPTHDDITTECIALAFGRKVIRHPEAERRLRAHYTTEQINAARLKMADVPEGAELIDNPVSVAPGYQVENVYVMAGVPSIMQAMFGNIKHQLKGGAKVESRTVSAYATEGNIAEELTAIQKCYPEVEIGSYPFMKDGLLGVSLVARGQDVGMLEHCERELDALLRKHDKSAA